MVPGSTLIYGSNFCMVTLSPRSTSSRPNDAAAMPFPREDTTPPVTKMYLVALGPVVIRPVLGKRASGLPPVANRPPYRCREAPPHPGGRPRSSFRSAGPAVARVALPAPLDWAAAL